MPTPLGELDGPPHVLLSLSHFILPSQPLLIIAPFGRIEVGGTLSGCVTRIACILNPNARDGLSLRQWERFEPALSEAGFDVDLRRTEGPGHAMDIAQELVGEDHEIVVAVGGDGTVH